MQPGASPQVKTNPIKLESDEIFEIINSPRQQWNCRSILFWVSKEEILLVVMKSDEKSQLKYVIFR